MGFIRSALRSTSSSLTDPQPWMQEMFGGGSTSSGIFVNQDTAMHYAPFFAGVQVISSDIGSLPLPLYERLDRGKRRADDHPLYEVLHDQANDFMSAMDLRETLTGHALTWGLGCAYIERTSGGHVESLWPLRPDQVRPRLVGDGRRSRLVYVHTPHDGPQSVLLPDEVLAVHGLGSDGVRGYSLVRMARQSIGLGLATEAFGSAWFGNGSRPSGVLQHPGTVSEPARLRMKTDWDNLHRGVDRAHRVAILEEGVSWHQIGIPPEDAQFLETRRFQVTEMARWLRLPPHKIGDLENASFNNIEWSSMEYVTESLRSWLVRWEQAIRMRLLTKAERRRYFAEHIVEALLRGDIKSRYEAYAIGRNWGWLSADDVRDKENENPLPNGKGTIYLQPLNMVEAGATLDEVEPARLSHARALRGRGTAARKRIAAAFAPLFADADARLAKLERAEVAALVRKHLDPERSAGTRDGIAAFLAALWKLYDGLVRGKTAERWTPVLQALMVEVIADAIADVGFDGEVDLDRWLRGYVAVHVDYRVNTAYGRIRAALDDTADGDQAAAVLALLDEVVDTRPERTARWQTSQLPNAAARETYRAAGVTALRWVTVGDSCPFCTELDGRVVAIDQAFVVEGSEVGLGAKLGVKRDTFHPPLHPGCDCEITTA
ncbi:MAG TPA: phage portal protein [Actinokineospora sp.]|nr:phage portal protein [Actinokineospora sp.]